MSSSGRQRTVQLRDGSRAILRPIEPDDKQLLVDAFERLSADSRYRRFFAPVRKLGASDLAYLTEVDHHDHEAIVAIDASAGAAVGVARYIRSTADAAEAEAAVTVVDDWHGRGLGRALLVRLAGRARRAGIRRFTALVQGDNVGVVELLRSIGPSERVALGSDATLVVELPKRGIGARLARALRAAATGSLVAAGTLADRMADETRRAAAPPPRPLRRMSTIVVGTDGSPAGERALSAAAELAGRLGAGLHVVSAYRFSAVRDETDAILARARRAARVGGRPPSIHARRGDAAEALIAVAEQHDADLIVVGDKGVAAPARFLLGSVAHKVSHQAPCSVLIIRRPA